MNYFEMSKEELDAQLEKFKNEYAEYKKMNLNLQERTQNKYLKRWENIFL